MRVKRYFVVLSNDKNKRFWRLRNALAFNTAFANCQGVAYRRSWKEKGITK